VLINDISVRTRRRLKSERHIKMDRRNANVCIYPRAYGVVKSSACPFRTEVLAESTFIADWRVLKS
jgi:hypothetical protein